MSTGAPAMRWWGWGDGRHAGGLPPAAVPLLQAEIGLGDGRRVAFDQVRVGDSALPEGVRDALAAAVGAGNVLQDRAARIERSAGRSYPDLLRLRAGDAEQAPDAVVLPGSHEEVRAVLDLCARHGVAVVPFGGGTSVVGGVEPWRAGFGALISLDLRRMAALHSVDERSLTAVVGPGIRGPALEAALGDRGLTLGHFPQSFEYVSIGGCVATRSAGQASTGYGSIADQVLGLRCAAPATDIVCAPHPATAAGPQVRELMVGSEGLFGVLTELTMRVRRAPAETRYEGFIFPSFTAGSDALRVLAQEEAAPDVTRLSDEEETRISLAMSDSGGLKGQIAKRYLKARHVERGAIVIAGWEGEHEDVGARRARSAEILGRHGAVGLGRTAGNAWAKGRFHGPYLRDDLMDRGVMVDTLETATSWSNLFTLYRAVGDALREHAAVVMCHVSHVYPSGASLYFTYLARQDAQDPLGQWQRVKRAATDAIVAAGGTITHHHGVGRDHAPWMQAEVGDGALAALHAVKRQLDPAGIMNPGKLLGV